MSTAPSPDGAARRLHLPAGTAAAGPYEVRVTPEDAGWAHSSLRVLALGPGASHEVSTGDEEVVVVPLQGALVVDCDGERAGLDGRAGVFDGPTDFAYLPREATALLTSPGGGRYALCGARAERSLPFRYGPVADVPVELRGAGRSSREVRNFATAGVFEADALIACEVVTPAGNWSSYPPHKHDETSDVESELEEVYYFEVAPGPQGQPGFGLHRVYGTPERPVDVLAEVRDRDVVLVPHGWHGPSVASPGHHLYYLNVMAGPGPERAWRIVDDPDHAWVRETWADQEVDPRLPLRPAAAGPAQDPEQHAQQSPQQSLEHDPSSDRTDGGQR